MNTKQEKLFWLVAMISSWLLGLWVFLLFIGNSDAKLIHLLGMVLLCYFTTTSYISMFNYNERN